MVIRRISPLSCAKISGILYAGIGLFIGGCVSLFWIVASGFAGEGYSDPSGAVSALFGTAAVVVLPIVYGVMGFVGGAVTAWLYNIVAGMTGGLEIEVS